MVIATCLALFGHIWCGCSVLGLKNTFFLVGYGTSNKSLPEMAIAGTVTMCTCEVTALVTLMDFRKRGHLTTMHKCIYINDYI